MAALEHLTLSHGGILNGFHEHISVNASIQTCHVRIECVEDNSPDRFGVSGCVRATIALLAQTTHLAVGLYGYVTTFKPTPRVRHLFQNLKELQIHQTSGNELFKWSKHLKHCSSLSTIRLLIPEERFMCSSIQYSEPFNALPHFLKAIPVTVELCTFFSEEHNPIGSAVNLIGDLSRVLADGHIPGIKTLVVFHELQNVEGGLALQTLCSSRDVSLVNLPAGTPPPTWHDPS